MKQKKEKTENIGATKMIKDKQGKEYTFKEFLKKWKQGMNEITPVQQLRSNNLGYYLIFLGEIVGFITSVWMKQWWLLIILIGSVILTAVAYIGNWQQLQLMLKQEEIMKSIDIQTIELKGGENGF